MDINEQTRVPLFVVLGAVPVIIGFIFWLSTIYSATVQAQDTNEKQDAKIERLYDLLVDIHSRVVRIEEKLSK